MQATDWPAGSAPVVAVHGHDKPPGAQWLDGQLARRHAGQAVEKRGLRPVLHPRVCSELDSVCNTAPLSKAPTLYATYRELVRSMQPPCG